jgi:hypothetical protein
MPDYLLNDHTNTAASGAGMLRDGLSIVGKSTFVSTVFRLSMHDQMSHTGALKREPSHL